MPSKVELSQGVVPTRPMRKDVDIIKPNIAVSVVVDGSSSMDSHTSPTASGLYALMDAFSSVGAKTEALAFMRGAFYGTGDEYTRKCEATIRYHKRFTESGTAHQSAVALRSMLAVVHPRLMVSIMPSTGRLTTGSMPKMRPIRCCWCSPTEPQMATIKRPRATWCAERVSAEWSWSVSA